MRGTETAEIRSYRAVTRYRMTDHKRNEDFRNSTYRNGGNRTSEETAGHLQKTPEKLIPKLLYQHKQKDRRCRHVCQRGGTNGFI